VFYAGLLNLQDEKVSVPTRLLNLHDQRSSADVKLVRHTGLQFILDSRRGILDFQAAAPTPTGQYLLPYI
jgi:hypothetical protein